MPKIAHLSDTQQDTVVAARNEDQMTRVSRATVKAGAETPKTRDGVARAPARAGADTAKAGAGVVRAKLQVVANTSEENQDLHESTRKLTEENWQFGRAFAELLGEQNRENMETLGAIATAGSWKEVVQAYRNHAASSFLRISRFNTRHGQFLLSGMTATAPFSQR